MNNNSDSRGNNKTRRSFLLLIGWCGLFCFVAAASYCRDLLVLAGAGAVKNVAAGAAAAGDRSRRKNAGVSSAAAADNYGYGYDQQHLQGHDHENRNRNRNRDEEEELLLQDAQLPLPLQVIEQYKRWHSVDAIRRQPHNRTYVKGIIACPYRAGNFVHFMLSDLIFAVMTKTGRSCWRCRASRRTAIRSSTWPAGSHGSTSGILPYRTR